MCPVEMPKERQTDREEAFETTVSEIFLNEGQAHATDPGGAGSTCRITLRRHIISKVIDT